MKFPRRSISFLYSTVASVTSPGFPAALFATPNNREPSSENPRMFGLKPCEHLIVGNRHHRGWLKEKGINLIDPNGVIRTVNNGFMIGRQQSLKVGSNENHSALMNRAAIRSPPVISLTRLSASFLLPRPRLRKQTHAAQFASR